MGGGGGIDGSPMEARSRRRTLVGARVDAVIRRWLRAVQGEIQARRLAGW